ncbi:MAG: alpha/beta hydrolase [Actinobacteria bacterium]|nr:MAG: alpha/beta hydrolase [Actinomycetota bacterium]
MPDVSHRGCNIHYEVEGSGPLIVLQHGFFSNQSSWKEYGYVDGLKESFTVATVDSLGHGQSDKPTQSDRYRLEERAGDIVAVIDALGQDKAHVLGYSMGGWLAVGVAMHYPDRLKSLTIAGWDCVEGMGSLYRAMGIDPIDFETFLGAARAVAPELVEWVTDDDVGALGLCYTELGDLAGSERAVLNLDVPVLLWDGREDPYHAPMEAFAAAHSFQFLSTAGDHIGAMESSAAEVVAAVQSFIANPTST